MKKKITLFLIAISTVVLFINLNNNNLHSNGSGAPASHTGSPGDNLDCSNCHITAGTVATGGILISSNVPSGGYISGNTYQITVRAAHATFNKFGFQASPQSSSGALLGSLATTNNVETQLVGSGKYITHKAAGTAGTSVPMVGNYKEWSFNWTAPAVGTGNVTFYAAAILANGNNQNNGDSLVKGTLVINESATNGIEQTLNTFKNAVFPNPVSNNLNLILENNAEISIFSANGQLVLNEKYNMGLNNLNVETLKPGIYFIKIEQNSKTEILKFVKQ